MRGDDAGGCGRESGGYLAGRQGVKTQRKRCSRETQRMVSGQPGFEKFSTTLSLQDTVQQAGSVHLAERTLLLLPSHPTEHFMASARAKLTAEGLREGARYVVRGHNTSCIKQGNIKRAQGFCPWSPSQEGQGETRALHHQPRPSIDLDHALLSLSSSQLRDRGGLLETTVWEIKLTNGENA